MLTVRLVRHGESAANVGGTTSDPASIPLTPRGMEQARAVCAGFTDPPDWIVCSPFLRTRQTVSPICERFPTIPVHIWPIHEFTYLSPARCANTSAEQRRPWVERFWNEADPFAIDGPGAESFSAFVDRVDDLLDRLETLPGMSGAIFGHGQFMQAFRWRMTARNEPISPVVMRAFRAADLASPIANAAGFTVSLDGKAWDSI